MKKLASMVAVIAILAVLAACAIGGYSAYKKNNPATPGGTEKPPVIIENPDPDKVYVMPKTMTFSSMTSGNSVTIKATVDPDYALNKNINWSVEFVNPASAWVGNKTATNYITVTPQENTQIATVEHKARFGAQIKITATSASNPAAKAECICDCLEEVYFSDWGVEGQIIDDMDKVLYRNSMNYDTEEIQGLLDKDALTNNEAYYNAYKYVELSTLVGTVSEKPTGDITITISYGEDWNIFAEEFAKQGLDTTGMQDYTATVWKINSNQLDEDGYLEVTSYDNNMVFDKDCITDTVFEISPDDYGKALVAFYNSYERGAKISMVVSVKTTLNRTVRSEARFKFNPSNLMVANLVTLDSDKIEF